MSGNKKRKSAGPNNPRLIKEIERARIGVKESEEAGNTDTYWHTRLAQLENDLKQLEKETNDGK